MSVFTNYKHTQCYTWLILVVMGISSLMMSCGFVGEELKQDRALAGYRNQIQQLADSVPGSSNRIEAYKHVIAEVSQDELLITLRKKNKLLSEIYYFITNEYFEKGNLKNALESSTLAIAFNKENQYAYYNRACIHQELGEDSLALLDYSKAIQYDNYFVDSYYNRGLLHEKDTNYKQALEDYTKAIMLNPPYLSDVYNNRGNIYQQMDLYDEAIADYDRALEKDTTMAIAYCNRADAYLKKGELERALVDYERATLADSTDYVVRDHIRLVEEAFARGRNPDFIKSETK